MYTPDAMSTPFLSPRFATPWAQQRLRQLRNFQRSRLIGMNTADASTLETTNSPTS
jgi:hypothetical protein